jgi:hypothetical protein
MEESKYRCDISCIRKTSSVYIDIFVQKGKLDIDINLISDVGKICQINCTHL